MRFGWIMSLLLSLAFGLSSAAQEQTSAFVLYQRGETKAAKAAFETELARARAGNNQQGLWHALMGSAWYADETGDHKNAIIYSNEALELAGKINNPFMIGRSLTWLGWAYSSMGRYMTAVEFYSEAVRIGAPDGKIEIIPVWGLASQELGAIYFKMGDTAKAKEILEETLKVAREHKVLAGIAEGASHLAEIALATGSIDEAWRWSSEAVKAAIDCACSPFNIARARIVQAKVAFKKAERKSTERSHALELLDEAINYSEKVGVNKCLAEGKIMKSKALPAEDFDERYKLLSDALVLLSESESELRGTAEGKVGELFLEQNKKEYAGLYLKQGLKVNEEMLRQIDNAHIITSIAELEKLNGHQKKSLEELKKATDLALSTGELTLAAVNSEKLADSFLELGYDSMAVEWYRTFLKTTDKLIEKEESTRIQDRLTKHKLTVMQKYAELAAELAPDTHAQSP